MNATGSDSRLKTDIREIEPRALHRHLPFVSYTIKETKHKGLGVIAQDVFEIEPIYTGTFEHNGGTFLSIDKPSMAYEQAMWSGHAIDRIERILEDIMVRLDKLEADK